MSDHHDESAAVPWGLPTVQVILVSLMVALLGALLVAPSFGESGQAVATVGLVLAEAITLYVGYGALMRVASPAVCELLVSD